MQHATWGKGQGKGIWCPGGFFYDCKVCAQVNAFCLLHAFSMQNGSNESFLFFFCCCFVANSEGYDSAKWSAKVKLKSENDENVQNETCAMQQQQQQFQWLHQCQWQQQSQLWHQLSASLPQLPLTVSAYKAFKLATAKAMLLSVSACHMPHASTLSSVLCPVSVWA